MSAATIAGQAAEIAELQAENTRLHAENYRLTGLAYTDELTGLANRRALERDLADQQASGRRYSVAILDLDRFKEVNDTYGHDVGDIALYEVADRLRSVAEDLGALAARLGGDEFVFIGRRADIALAASARLAPPVDIGGGAEIQVTASIGVCHATPGADPARVMHAADIAAYQAKAAGGGRVVVWDAGLPGAPERPRLRYRRTPVGGGR